MLDDVADAILDGTAIDWDQVEARAGADRLLLEGLKELAALANVHRDVPPPARWGHLALIEPLGRGAFGRVFRARDTRLDREVALKLLEAPSTGGDARASSIVDEGRRLAQVRHPNVVTIYGAARIGDEVGLWMELVQGRTLQQLLDEGRRFTAAEAVEIGGQLCDAVAAVHDAGLLHRDIKAANVMLSDNGRVVLMDFGTGWEARDSSRAVPAGTPLYLAPELLEGGEPTVRTDIYAVGVLLFLSADGSLPGHCRRHRRTETRPCQPGASRPPSAAPGRPARARRSHRGGDSATVGAPLQDRRRDDRGTAAGESASAEVGRRRRDDPRRRRRSAARRTGISTSRTLVTGFPGERDAHGSHPAGDQRTGREMASCTFR